MPSNTGWDRRLSKPPIAEALIDFRVDGVVRPITELVGELRKRVGPTYPKTMEQRGFQATLGMAGGPSAALPTAETLDLGVTGVSFHTENGKQVVQFQNGAFTFNMLRPYSSWEPFSTECLRLWEVYADIAKPKTVTRLGVRYINRIPIPGTQLALADYLRTDVPVPPEIEGSISSLLTSVVMQQENGRSVRVTQRLEPTSPMEIVLLLDIDAFWIRDWEPTDNELPSALQKLREMKNTAFFSCVSEKLVEQFR